MNNRKQVVSINGFESSKLNITCGVPQGSTLGPLLFLIYLNDLRFCFNKSRSNHFADHTCLIYASKKVKTLETDLNTDLKATSEWLKANRLSLNIKKSQLIIFHSKSKKVDFISFSIKLEGSKLKPSKYVKYLGIYIGENLSWSTYINEPIPIPIPISIPIHHLPYHDQIHRRRTTTAISRNYCRGIPLYS